MKAIIAILTILVSVQAFAEDEYIAAPDSFTEIHLSNSNPNRFHCVNGNVNDVAYPADVPIDAKTKDKNLFISYKLLQGLSGETEYVSKRHDIHVVCGGEVFSFSVIPERIAQSKVVRMGDPNRKFLEENAKQLREMSEEELYASLVMTALKNDYKGNITATQQYKKIPQIIPNVTIEETRQLTMSGAGLRLREYTVTAEPGKVIQKEQLIDSSLSSSMLAIAVHPAKTGSDGKTRLFVVEKKI